MAQLHRNERQIELKCNADKLFEVLGHKPYLMASMCPDKVSKVELLQGDWDKVGAVHAWHYLIDGGAQLVSVTAMMEEIDEENKYLSFIYCDGSVGNYFKSLKEKVQVIPKDEGCIIKLSYEYEKKKEDDVGPNLFVNKTLDSAIDIAKAVASHLCDA